MFSVCLQAAPARYISLSASLPPVFVLLEYRRITAAVNCDARERELAVKNIHNFTLHFPRRQIIIVWSPKKCANIEDCWRLPCPHVGGRVRCVDRHEAGAALTGYEAAAGCHPAAQTVRQTRTETQQYQTISTFQQNSFSPLNLKTD